MAQSQCFPGADGWAQVARWPGDPCCTRVATNLREGFTITGPSPCWKRLLVLSHSKHFYYYVNGLTTGQHKDHKGHAAHGLVTIVSVTQFHIYLPCLSTCLALCLKCESASRSFQLGEGPPSRGVLSDCETSPKVRFQLYCTLHPWSGLDLGPYCERCNENLMDQPRLPGHWHQARWYICYIIPFHIREQQ